MDAQKRTRNIVVPAKHVNNRTLENTHKNIRISEWGVSPHAVISSLGAMWGSLVAGKSSVSSSRDRGQARARPDHRFCCFFFALLCFWFCFLFAIMCCVIYVAFLYICYYFWFYVCVLFSVFFFVIWLRCLLIFQVLVRILCVFAILVRFSWICLDFDLIFTHAYSYIAVFVFQDIAIIFRNAPYLLSAPTNKRPFTPA